MTVGALTAQADVSQASLREPASEVTEGLYQQLVYLVQIEAVGQCAPEDEIGNASLGAIYLRSRSSPS